MKICEKPLKLIRDFPPEIPWGTFNILPPDSIEYSREPLYGLHSPWYPSGFSKDCTSNCYKFTIYLLTNTATLNGCYPLHLTQFWLRMSRLNCGVARGQLPGGHPHHGVSAPLSGRPGHREDVQAPPVAGLGAAVRRRLTSIRCTLDHSGNDHFLDFGYAWQCKLLPRHIEINL